MTTEIDLVREKQPFLTKISFLNEAKFKFLQIKKDTIGQKCCQKHEKRFCKCQRTDKVWHTIPLYATVRILNDLHVPTVMYVVN